MFMYADSKKIDPNIQTIESSIMRIVLLGDDGVGKSTIITCLFKDKFVPNIEDLLPPLFFPTYDDQTVAVVDTSPALSHRTKLLTELRQANCIWLVYSDNYTMERVSLFWLPFLRNHGVNLPIILCQNKQDQLFTDGEEEAPAISVEEEDDAIELMQDFKEIESFVRCSAKAKRNVNEAFYLCQRAIVYPLAPLYDSKVGQLKPLCIQALGRIFFLLDEDQSGVMTPPKLERLQQLVFSTNLGEEEVSLIHETLAQIEMSDEEEGRSSPFDVLTPPPETGELYSDALNGMTLLGFLRLAQVYCERGRHETIWAILRYFHYTDSLSIDEQFLRPPFSVDSQSHVELSPDGYQFLVDLFTLFDRDNDGGLSPAEMSHLFTPTPGIPELWRKTNFPFSTLRNDDGYVSLQGWLAQWSMFVFLEYSNALAYLAMLGYNQRAPGPKNIKSALRITKPAKKRNPRSNVYRQSTVQDRQVFNCLVFGSSGAGKSTLLSSFLGSGKAMENNPRGTPRTVVNSVELPGGKQSYLIMQELDNLEDTILNSPRKLDECDVVCLTYDSSDPDSFAHLVNLRQRHPEIDKLPLVFAALKADQDRAQQRCAEQPDEYTSSLGVAAPMHVSSDWPSSLNALFVQLVEVSMHPGMATVTLPGEDTDNSILPELIGLGAAVASVVAFSWWWTYHRR